MKRLRAAILDVFGLSIISCPTGNRGFGIAPVSRSAAPTIVSGAVPNKIFPLPVSALSSASRGPAAPFDANKAGILGGGKKLITGIFEFNNVMP